MHRYRRSASVEILRVSAQNLAAFGFNNIAPHPGRMHMGSRECALKGEMILLTWRERIKLQHLQTEQVSQVMGITCVRGNVMLIDQAAIESADQDSTVLDVELQ